MHVTYVVSRWGEPTQTFVRREVEAVRSRGVDVTVCSLKPPRKTDFTSQDCVPVCHESWYAVAGGFFVALLLRPMTVLRMLWAVSRRSRLKNMLPQVAALAVGCRWATAGRLGDRLHAHFGWVSGTAAWAAGTMAGRPFSVTLHAFEIHSRKLRDDFAPVPLRAADTVFAISRFDASELEAWLGRRVDVVRMTVPDWWAQYVSEECVRDPWRVVSVGSLVPKKGHDVLLRALAHADERWKLEVIGGGDPSQLESLADRLGIATRVDFTGPLATDQVHAKLEKAAVSALACVSAPDGDRDGIPVALIEAMALGTPVISTRLGGIPELVEGAGLLVPPDDPDALAHALDELRDPARRSRLGAAAHARVRTEFSSAAAVDTLFAAWKQG